MNVSCRHHSFTVIRCIYIYTYTLDIHACIHSYTHISAKQTSMHTQTHVLIVLSLSPCLSLSPSPSLSLSMPISLSLSISLSFDSLHYTLRQNYINMDSQLVKHVDIGTTAIRTCFVLHLYAVAVCSDLTPLVFVLYILWITIQVN